MSRADAYSALADGVLLVHALFVCFVVLGLAAIYVGHFCHWRWVRNPWFRLAHLLAIAIVVLQSWLGVICPLTIWEMQLRDLAGLSIYEGSFIQHWLHRLLYYQAPDWVFVTGYSAFGCLVLLSWWVVCPRRIFYRLSKSDITDT